MMAATKRGILAESTLFLVSDRAQLGEIVQRVRDERSRANIGNIAPLDEAVAAFNPA